MANGKAQRHPKTFQGRLKHYMQSRGWNRSKLASEAKLDLDTVHKWFQRGGNPRVDQLVRLAKCTRLSPNWLLLGEGPEDLGSSRPMAELADDFVGVLTNRMHEFQDIQGGPAYLPPAAEVLQDVLTVTAERYKPVCRERAAKQHREMNSTTEWLKTYRERERQDRYIREQVELGPLEAMKRDNERHRAEVIATLEARLRALRTSEAGV